MNADGLSAELIRVCESCFPRKNPGKFLAGYLFPDRLKKAKLSLLNNKKLITLIVMIRSSAILLILTDFVVPYHFSDGTLR